MITSSREKGFEAKQEGEGNDNIKFTKAPPSTSRQWSAFRNPRIVRVSRSLGGKDRHSKVCTVRGLRDRRIRLSVPTAIQLYDLQDRLGLSQPSKVIDWLLDATKDDIDKLPPLQLPQGFGQFHQPLLLSHDQSSNSSIAPFFDANSTFNKDIGFHSLGIKVNNNSNVAEEKYWEAETSLRATSNEKGKWVKTNDHQAQNLFPIASINNPVIPLNPQLYHWDAASNLSLSQFGTNHGLISTHQQENAAALLNTNPSSSTVSLPGSQFYMFPQYPPYAVATPMENNESRETNHFQWLTSSLGPHHHSRRNSGTQPDK